jgi:DNA-binding transcriptional MocR family regulator
MWLKISSPADALFSSMLNDEGQLDHFITTNRQRLASAYGFATRVLKRYNIPYIPSAAGHFVFIDLRAFLPAHGSDGKVLANDAEKEAALFLALLNNGVYIAPGAFVRRLWSHTHRTLLTVRSTIITNQAGCD